MNLLPNTKSIGVIQMKYNTDSWSQLIKKHGFVSIHRVDDHEGTYEVYKTPCGKHKLEYYFDTEEFKSSWYYKHNDTYVIGLKNKPNLVSHYISTGEVLVEEPDEPKPEFESLELDDDLPF